MATTYETQLIFLRGLLTGYGYYKALAALELAKGFHDGIRKDGITPEFHHQIRIAQILDPVLHHCLDPELVMAGVMVHDLVEDHPESTDGIIAIGSDIYELGRTLDKTGLETEAYYREILESPHTTVIKGADRLHNIQTMAGVFSIEKIRKYIEETEQFALPMLKAARRKFTTQARVYVYLSETIKAQISTVEALLRQCEAATKTQCAECGHVLRVSPLLLGDNDE